MGRRARKRQAPKVRVGRVTKKKLLKRVPARVRPLPNVGEVEWDRDASLRKNYAALGCAADVNRRGGRQRESHVSEGGHETEMVAMEELERIRSDDGCEENMDVELRMALGKPIQGRKVLPKKLTRTQFHVIEQLVQAHGNDLEAMSKDRKRNPMLHTVATLRKMVHSYQAYPGLQQQGGWRGFRAPSKRAG